MSNGALGSDPFTALVGKALVDDDFRKLLLNQATQKDALREIGIANASQDQLDALNGAIAALQGLEGEFRPNVGTG